MTIKLVAPPTPSDRRKPDSRPTSVVVDANGYQRVRAATESLAGPLATEDYVVQSMPDVSPTKWHLAHVTWFFETFVLTPHLKGYAPFDPAFHFLFNSYYLGAGERHCRDQRGYISRPTVTEVYEYRGHVDQAMARLLTELESHPEREEVRRVTEIGLHHEQQHQELLLTDIKHVLSVNPLRPRYLESASPAGDPSRPDPQEPVEPIRWISFPEGLVDIGTDPGSGFAYDNESPRHRFFVQGFDIADRLVTNGEFLAFMEDGGYQRGDLWLSEGWAAARANDWSEPFYWERRDDRWQLFTLGGMRDVDPNEPASHINYFEADAYARWCDTRLPSEQEWEVAAQGTPIAGNFVESGRLHPGRVSSPGVSSHALDTHQAADANQNQDDADQPRVRQLFGDVWEWTRSQYSPYPGYRAAEGTLGEYNGKFMSNQFVLRGGSCVTPVSHIRPTYRNFFPAATSWQFSGIRLARDR
ncbi:MAG: ergothioneine biosynthesis protein EgtB [Thermoanaerobaculia bacterium]|nr:ergothioneine biosynthesis protein EgtB [Thermoanaerobaculia bacterium]